MQSISKKRRTCESNDGMEDRLSGLPDEVIVHILSFMPTLDAVRTMLIRQLRNLWTLVPALRNLGNISKDAKIIGDVRMWLRYAIEKEVRVLYFRYSAPFDPPRCIFTSQSLATLALLGCTIEHYVHQSQIHLGSLRKLSLIGVKGSTKSYDQLISGCPSLQELIVYFAATSGFEILNINAPSVSKLRICVLNIRCSCTLNCPSLKILDIGVSEKSPYFQLSVTGVISLQEVNVEYLPTRYYSGEVQPFFKLLQNAEVFTLSCKAFKELSNSSTEKMEFSLNTWRRIVLHLEWNGERCLEVIFKLMKKSVNLKELIIYAGESSGDDCELLCPELTACVLPLLKTVTIHGNHGYKKWCEGQLQVIEFLLTNGVVLEKLVITFGKNKLTTVEKVDLVKQVSTFRRASSNATVIFV
ncbi:F-box/FBD/LRR-repeat protein At5g56420-like isoform X2 [Silene latifolia]|uniref:F-box/FBD/LRR-repeat protein At5g56420-like isoform X2 n=1 Tax=Silene latifolia TaxID=37657 RepID=UPI003D7747E3